VLILELRNQLKKYKLEIMTGMVGKETPVFEENKESPEFIRHNASTVFTSEEIFGESIKDTQNNFFEEKTTEERTFIPKIKTFNAYSTTLNVAFDVIIGKRFIDFKICN
jgi:hypothetical protein